MKTRPVHIRIMVLLLCLSMLLGFAPAVQLFSTAQAAAVSHCGVDHTGFTPLGTVGAATPVEVLPAALQGGGSFKLVSDIKLTAQAVPTADTHIDLNGFTISCADTGPRLGLGSNIVMTLCDTSAAQTGKLDGSNHTAANGVVNITGASTFNFYGGTISGSNGTADRCAAIRMNTGAAHVNMHGGKITGCKGTKGPAVYIQAGGSFNMYGGEISGNTATGDGGAIYSMHACPITIDGGKITGNTADNCGGAIAVNKNTAVINIKSGEISGNQAANAGAIWPSDLGATLNISGGKITENVVTGNGSAILTNKAKVNISGGEITGNIGGAVLALSDTTLNMTGGTIRGNVKKATSSELSSVALNNYKAPTVGAFSGNAVVENPINVATTVDENHPAISSATIGTLTSGARILANTKLSTLDTSAAESATADGKYLYTYLGQPNGITINDGNKIKVPESAIGTTQQLTVAANEGITLPTDPANVLWVVEDENVVAVDQNGLLTFKGYGSSKVTAYILDAEGNKTEYYNFVEVQIGEDPLRILSIGDSFSRDSLYYVSHLANIYGQRVEAAYMEIPDGALRKHSLNLAESTPAYTYYSTNPVTGEMIYRAGAQAIRNVVNENSQWDVIILSQAVLLDGFNGTYNEDLQYLLDFLADVQPNAKVYWNSTWSTHESGDVGGNLTKHYRGNPDYHYNAILDNLDKHILSDKFEGIDGWLPTGVAIENLRGKIDHDLALTRDGANLSLDIGRLTAAMAVLKALDPTLELNQITAAKVNAFLNVTKTDNDPLQSADNSAYIYSDADLPKIIAAVEAACSDLSKAPARKAVEDVPVSENADVTVGKTTTPLMMHFPDVKVTSDDTVWVNAYVNVTHYPRYYTEDADTAMYQGVGELVVWSGKQDYTSQQWQESYEDPSLVITQKTLEDWGLVQISGRYERLKNSSETSYLSLADARDGNLAVVTTDTDGDGDQEDMVLYTFWIRHYNQVGAQTGYEHILAMTWATQDENGDWVWADKAQILHPTDYGNGEIWRGVKRGDITSFSDGRILIPCYSASHGAVPEDAEYEASTSVTMYMEFDWEKQEWVPIYRYTIPNFNPGETTNWNEVSLAAPDPDGNTVYAIGRESGTVLVSYDRGIHWEEVANEPGTISHPSMTRIDENRVFACWTRSRDGGKLSVVVGKVFYINGGWGQTRTQVIYDTPVLEFHDMGDCHGTLLPNGKIMVVNYDTAFNSIVGSFVDLDAPENLPIELDETVQEYKIYESNAQAALSDANAIPDSVKVYGAHTVTAKVTFTAASGQAVIATPAGSITLSGYAQGDVVNVIVKTVGQQLFVKTWKEGATEPENWTVLAKQGTAAEQPAITGSGATLNQVAITCRMVLELQESLSGKFADPKAQLVYLVQPEAAVLTFTSSDENVVKVSDQGEVTFVGAGKAVITMKVNEIAELKCNVEVAKAPAEVLGEGETKVILWDDFEEDKYTDNGTDNEFWDDYWKKTKSSLYILRNAVGMSESVTTGKGKYDIVKEANGNQYLELKEKTTWLASAAEITGPYTVSFDVLFTGHDKSLNLTMWQNEAVEVHEDGTETATAGNEIHAFVNLTSRSYRYQYREYSLFTHPSKTATATQPVANPDLYVIGDNVRAWAFEPSNGTIDIWQSVKLVRVDGGLYMKLWNKYDEEGNLVPEPTEWTCLLNDNVLDADIPSHFRMQFDCGSTGYSAYIDNLLITQQVEVPSAVEATRMELHNSLNMQFAVPMDQQTDWTGAYAKIVQTHIDGSTETQEVPFADWTTDDNMWVVPFNGVAAKEMTDEVVVTIYDKDGNQIGASYTSSIRDYAMRVLNSTDPKYTEAAKKMLVDMLNYGAEAQKRFEYNQNDLANALLNDDQKALATQGSVTVNSTSEKVTMSRLKLENNIELQIVIPEAYAGETISYAFAHHRGGEVNVSEATVLYDAVNQKHYIVIKEIVVADARQMVTVKAGDEVIAQDSVEGYIARISQNNADSALYEAIIKFADAAKAYFAQIS